MAMNMNNLLKLSFIVQKLAVLSRNTVIPIRLIRTSCYFRAKHLKDYEAHTSIFEQYQNGATRKKNSEMIIELQSCSTHHHVFQVLERYGGKHMSGVEAFKALQVLFLLRKSRKAEDHAVATKKEFALLCDILKRRMKELSIGELIESLRILNHFHVPSSTCIINDILDIIRKSANELSTDQILKVNSTLFKCQKTSLVKALLIALPIILKTRENPQFDNGDIDSLVRCLRSYTEHRSKKDAIPRVLTVLNNLDVSLIKLKHAKIIISSMAKLRGNDVHTDLWKKCEKVLTDRIYKLNSEELLCIVNAVSQAVQHGHESLYNESLLDTCAMITISQNFGLDFAIRILANFSKINHTNNSLLDYIAAKVFENQNIGKTVDFDIVKVLITGMSVADYKPVFWGALEDRILNEKFSGISHGGLLKLGIHLATLDCYCPELLAQVFDERKFHQCNHSMRPRLLLLYNAVKTFYPKYDGPWPSVHVLETWKRETSRPKNFWPLKSALETALGGPQYVLTQVLTEQGYQIDHVIIMRKGGFPIAINNPGEYIPTSIEKLTSPENSQVILLSCISQYGYSRNTQRLTGMKSLTIRTLKSQLNYTIIPINRAIWDNLAEPEQVRYVSQAIRLKCEELSTVFNT